MKNSGLRGRGGAGFPTGVKWGFAAKYKSDTKCGVVCNADEGDGCVHGPRGSRRRPAQRARASASALTPSAATRAPSTSVPSIPCHRPPEDRHRPS
ncbi:MAG: hypothetical protein R2864_15050 [Syntrophotaleaceae bacterium]